MLRVAALFCLCSGRAAAQATCPPSADVELQLLTIRPWFCEMPGPQGRTETEDLLKCLGEGHVYNQTDVGLCQGRWQWYQVSTVHPHEVPYYEIEVDAEGRTERVRKTTEEELRHAVAFSLRTAYCPYSRAACDAGQEAGYYTTVDVMVVDGEPLHPWDTANPFCMSWVGRGARRQS